MDWCNLLNSNRRKDGKDTTNEPGKTPQTRTETERDYDRILFSTPVRRLADKTQVFPMEINDSVRTRLTHSHEVSNLARSIGTDLVFNHLEVLRVDNRIEPIRNIPSMLAAIGLAHDLGNPPFGHQGEKAIGKWFEENSVIFENQDGITKAMINDFVHFEGNAQTFRLVTKLQLLNDDFGLNLTYGTLAALLKYTVPSDKTDEKNSSRKKFGFFQSETKIVEDVWLKSGLCEGVRHPLTYIMEACDDIAYSVLDAEDSVKKQLVSFSDLISHLGHSCAGDPITSDVVAKAKRKYDEFRGSNLSPAELNDVSMQMFRVYAIHAMVVEVKEEFLKNYDSIMEGHFDGDLMGCSSAKKHCKELKAFDRANGYNHKSEPLAKEYAVNRI
jgi:dGTPase